MYVCVVILVVVWVLFLLGEKYMGWRLGCEIN